MIVKITSAQQAETILRTAQGFFGALVFDIASELNAADIPLVLRKCESCKEGEYCGPNIWGRNFEKRSTYCPKCGYAMRDKASVSVAIHGSRVVETDYRH